MSAGDALTHRAILLRATAEALCGAFPPLIVKSDAVAKLISFGDHGRRRPGAGKDFWQFRHYARGDPANRIDWRQSAKSQNIFLRENEWDTAESVWFWCDSSASMNYCSQYSQTSKQERAQALTLALAGLLMRGGERAGLLGHDMPPRKGRASFNWFADILLGATEAQNLPAAQKLPRFAKLVMIGDFLSPIEEITQCLHSFAEQGVRGYVLHILDPAEEDLPFSGHVRFEGLESEKAFTASRAQAIRGDYQLGLAQHRAGLAGVCNNAGWSLASHRTDRPAQLALLVLYQSINANPGRVAWQC